MSKKLKITLLVTGIILLLIIVGLGIFSALLYFSVGTITGPQREAGPVAAEKYAKDNAGFEEITFFQTMNPVNADEAFEFFGMSRMGSRSVALVFGKKDGVSKVLLYPGSKKVEPQAFDFPVDEAGAKTHIEAQSVTDYKITPCFIDESNFPKKYGEYEFIEYWEKIPCKYGFCVRTAGMTEDEVWHIYFDDGAWYDIRWDKYTEYLKMP